MRYNSKHKILFLKAPPVPWCNLTGLQYVSYEYYNNSILVTSEKGLDIKHVYNGNYTKLYNYITTKSYLS